MDGIFGVIDATPPVLEAPITTAQINSKKQEESSRSSEVHRSQPEGIVISSDSEDDSSRHTGDGGADKEVDMFDKGGQRGLHSLESSHSKCDDEVEASSTGTERIESVEYDSSAIEVFHRCLEELVVPPPQGFARDADLLRIQLKGFIVDFRRALKEDANAEIPLESGGRVRMRTYFNREGLQVIRHFLGTVVGIPDGGFGPSTLLMRRQLHVYLENLREIARSRSRI